MVMCDVFLKKAFDTRKPSPYIATTDDDLGWRFRARRFVVV